MKLLYIPLGLAMIFLNSLQRNLQSNYIQPTTILQTTPLKINGQIRLYDLS
jgi:hypothetical protein